MNHYTVFSIFIIYFSFPKKHNYYTYQLTNTISNNCIFHLKNMIFIINKNPPNNIKLFGGNYE